MSKKNVVSSYRLDSQTSNEKVDGSFTSYSDTKRKHRKLLKIRMKWNDELGSSLLCLTTRMAALNWLALPPIVLKDNKYLSKSYQ